MLFKPIVCQIQVYNEPLGPSRVSSRYKKEECRLYLWDIVSPVKYCIFVKWLPGRNQWLWFRATRSWHVSHGQAPRNIVLSLKRCQTRVMISTSWANKQGNKEYHSCYLKAFSPQQVQWNTCASWTHGLCQITTIYVN